MQSQKLHENMENKQLFPFAVFVWLLIFMKEMSWGGGGASHLTSLGHSHAGLLSINEEDKKVG